MDRPGNRYALSALRDKRSSLAGEIDAYRHRIEKCEQEMAHIDATLRLLAPSSDPTKLPKKLFKKHVKIFRQGDLGRLIMGVLRKAGRPLSTHEVRRAIEADGGFVDGSLARRVRTNLSYLTSTGRLVKIGRGRQAKWGRASQKNAQVGEIAA